MHFCLKHVRYTVACCKSCELSLCVCLFLQLQVFYNATLEEDERVAATLLLEFTKFENMERRELLIKVANWLQKNVDD